MTQKRITAGFWSYVHKDDAHEDGRITSLRVRLERSIQVFSGNDGFRIFQDRKDIGWGENWEERIADSLDDALLVFPVITPLYFASAACKKEILAFQNRQAKLQNDNLILPIYYLYTDQIENLDHIAFDSEENEVASLLRALQYEDWRTLRDASETDPAYRAAVERLAKRAIEALKRVPIIDPVSGPRARLVEKAPSAQKSDQTGGNSTPTVEVAETDPVHALTASEKMPRHIVTFTVNPMPNRAQFTTITEAIAAAPAGARILVSPGRYRESVVIDKPLELIGHGLRDDIIVEAEGSEALVFDTNIGVIRNLTLRQMQKTSENFCVSVKQGRLELEECDLSSAGWSCLDVTDNADPRVRRNRIHDGKRSGILIRERGRGTYEDNEIFGNGMAGIAVTSDAEPVVRRNRIYDGKQGGIMVYDQGKGTYEDNDIFSNTLSGIEVKTGAEPIVRRNRIHDGKASGIHILDQGKGSYEDNDIVANVLAGIEVKTGADPAIRRNRIYDGKSGGIYVLDEGKGTYEDNEIFGNAFSGIEVKNDGEPLVRRNQIHDGKSCGIYIHDQGKGTYEDNDIFRNTLSGIEVKISADPIVGRNRIYDGKSAGVYIHNEGKGTYENNDIFNNALAGITVASGGNPTVRKNRIGKNHKAGVEVVKDGAGLFEDNDLRESGASAWKIHPLAEANVKRVRNKG